MQVIKRDKCPITGTKEVEILSESPFPLFAGCVESLDNKDDLIPLQKWGIFKESGVLALLELIPLEILYKNGHDAGSVGALWEEHHREFAKFVMGFHPKSVLEIGGGHGKLSKESFKIADSNNAQKPRWTIIEPNSTNKIESVEYIDGFFGETPLENKFDCVVHSHTFEHMYNPGEFLSACNNALESCGGGGGYMIFTLPNMQKWLANKWTNCLNFEHTIFLSEKVIDFLLKASGFEVLEKKYFKEHSIFYATKKENKSAEKCIVDCHDLLRKSRNDDVLNVESLKQDYEKNKNLFLEMQEYYKEMIVKINKILMETSREVYLFGAHLFSQHLLYNGLDSKKVVGILDNNANKQGKRLYGTNLQVSSPRILSDKNALVILCAGAYNEEIKKDILENINRKVEVICF